MLKKLKVCTLHIHNILNTHSWRWIFVSGACLLCAFAVLTSSHGLSGSRGGGGGYSVRKLLGVCRGPLKIGPKKIEGKMVFRGQKDRILWGFVPKRSFLCWWMRKNTPKRSSLVPRGSKKGVKTAAHMYHPSYREYPPPPGSGYIHVVWYSVLQPYHAMHCPHHPTLTPNPTRLSCSPTSHTLPHWPLGNFNLILGRSFSNEL